METLPRRSRKPSCTLCSNHGIRSELKGHKYKCPYNMCECELCDKGRERREVMKKQVKLRRHQMRQIRKAPHGKAQFSKDPKIARILEKSDVRELSSEGNEQIFEEGGLTDNASLQQAPISPQHMFHSRHGGFITQSTSTPIQRHHIPQYYNYSSYLHLQGIAAQPRSPTNLSFTKLSPIGRLNISENSAFQKCSPVRISPFGFENALECAGDRAKYDEAALALASLSQSGTM